MSSAGVHPSAAESKRGRRERRKRAGELGWRGDDEGGKGGGVEDVGRNRGMFSAERERERERLRDCSGICFHFRKVLELMCIS